MELHIVIRVININIFLGMALDILGQSTEATMIYDQAF